MPSQCKSVCIPQFTPWFETRCTVDIDGYNNFRYPLCMGKLSYLKQKDDTPLITISTAEDDETMNGRKAGWTQGSSSNVYSTLGYGDEKVIRYVTELSQHPVTCPPCLSRRGNAKGTKWSWYTALYNGILTILSRKYSVNENSLCDQWRT